jgi:hypothetical protein
MDDYIDLNVPGLLARYSNPSPDWHQKVCALARTQLDVFKKHGLLKDTAPALVASLETVVVRFSDYTSTGQDFVKSGARDRWLSSCDRDGRIAAYEDCKRLEKRVTSFLASHERA